MNMVMSESGFLAQSGSSAPRRPRNREVTSRYKSTIPAAPSLNNRRYPTPNVDRTTSSSNASDAVPLPKRSLSAERRRPSPSRNGDLKKTSGDVHPVAPRRSSGVPSELLWPSTRSLSASMQCEPHPHPPPSVNAQSKKLSEIRGKVNGATSDHTLRPSANIAPRAADPRKPTPERKTTPRRPHQSSDQAENARPQDNIHLPEQQRGRSVHGITKLSAAALSRSVDLSADRERHGNRSSSVLVQGKINHGNTISQRSLSTMRSRPLHVNEIPVHPNGLPRPRSESRGRIHDSASEVCKVNNKASPPSISCRTADHFIDQAVRSGSQVGQAAELAGSETGTFTDNASDTDSVSSGGTTTTTSSSGWTTPGSTSVSRGARGTTVPARFLQDAAGRSRRTSEHNKLRSSMPENELLAASTVKPVSRCKTSESPRGSSANGSTAPPWSAVSSRSVSSFVPPQQLPHSLIKTSPHRNIPSPLRSRGGPLHPNSQRSIAAAMMLNFGPDARKAKKGLSQVEEIHLHRILNNRLLQWRFVKARAEGALNMQTFAAEKSLYNVCVRIFDLRSSVTKKKIKLQRSRQSEKLNSLLSVQAPKLDAWANIQHEHSVALKGVVQALEAAVLRVPVTGGVRADALSVKHAIGSAFDVMNTIENSVGYLLPKAEKTNSLLSELSYVASQERLLLEECASLLATASAMEAEECSLRTHLIQFDHERARVLGHLMDSTTAADSVLI